MDSRELDALIAEKVMGDVLGQALGPRPYSSDLAAAWTVVEHFNALPRNAAGGKRRPAKRFSRKLVRAGLFGMSPERAARVICATAVDVLFGVEVPA